MPNNLLIEIGTEELPPRSLEKLAIAFRKEMVQMLCEHELNFTACRYYATPRRLAVIIEQLATRQKDKTKCRRGPAVHDSFDANGNATQALKGFADSVNVGVDALEKIETSKGTWFAFNSIIKGQQTKTLVPDMLTTVLKRLPIAKRMRWGQYNFEFVRPIKWLVLLFGNDIIDTEVMGVKSANKTYGHRFHHPAAININHPDDYIPLLKQNAKVLADYDERKHLILAQITSLAKTKQGQVVFSQALLDEVTALVEWPVSFIGEFNTDFLKLPKEILVASMQEQQKCFPIIDQQNNLLPYFIGVANIDSTAAALIKKGNERVIETRLKDAAFFWEHDLNYGFINHRQSLKKVVYQKQLGTLYDKSQRLIKLVTTIIQATAADSIIAKRAAELCLCDLLTKIVTEFPKLQGTMGYYYATAAGESALVATALAEHYRPRFSGDSLPQSDIGKCLAISDKVDLIVGIFAIGKPPTGDKDPFGLRRCAIGLLRIAIEGKVDIDLKEIMTIAAANYPKDIKAKACIDNIMQFLAERLRYYYLDAGISSDILEAVLAIKTSQPLDFHQRLMAVKDFKQHAKAEHLIAANKRIRNLLKKSQYTATTINNTLLTEAAEIKLATLINEYQQKTKPLLAKRDYQAALVLVSELHDAVDSFFAEVMVMCDDDKVRANRCALLDKLHQLFLEIADISKLQI